MVALDAQVNGPPLALTADVWKTCGGRADAQGRARQPADPMCEHTQRRRTVRLASLTATWCAAHATRGARAPPLRARLSHVCATLPRQVKEGHDSTVRPKTHVYEFDNGRQFMDQWAADGKPALTRVHLRRVQFWKVLLAGILPPVLLLMDYGKGETFVSPAQRAFYSWWCAFTAIDAADAAKARAVMPDREPPPR